MCPATITSSQLWKAGQLSPLDKVHFKLQTLGALRACMQLCNVKPSRGRQANEPQQMITSVEFGWESLCPATTTTS